MFDLNNEWNKNKQDYEYGCCLKSIKYWKVCESKLYKVFKEMDEEYKGNVVYIDEMIEVVKNNKTSMQLF